MDAIRSALSDLDSGMLFDSDNGCSKLACKNYLISEGYRVTDPVKRVYKITKLDQLIDLFYTLLQRDHPEIGQAKNKSRDFITAKRFLLSRVSSGSINKIEALNECHDIILTVFKHYGEFNFNIPIFFGMFGQGAKFGWVTQKALDIMYNKNKSKVESEYKHKIEDADSIGDDVIGMSELDNILNNLE